MLVQIILLLTDYIDGLENYLKLANLKITGHQCIY